MILLSRVLLVVYGVLLIVGGAMGYAKAGSQASLIAGSIGGILALASSVVSFKRRRLGLALGLVVASAMGYERFKAYLDAPPDKPKETALYVAIGSLVVVVFLLAGLAVRGRRRK